MERMTATKPFASSRSLTSYKGIASVVSLDLLDLTSAQNIPWRLLQAPAASRPNLWSFPNRLWSSPGDTFQEIPYDSQG